MLAGALALAAALAVSGFLFARRAQLLVDLVRMGKPTDRFDDVPQRIRNEAEIVLGQRKLLQRLVPGLIHAAIFWGFLVLFPTIVIATRRCPGSAIRAGSPSWSTCSRCSCSPA